MPVGHSSYPQDTDLQAYLVAAGFAAADVAALGTSAAVRAGIQSFEKACNRHFLAGKDIANGTVAEETRYFDPPRSESRVLDLGPYGDLAAAPTSVVRQPAGSSPTTLVLNDDYVLLPENAPSIGWPYTSILIGPGGSWWSGWGWNWPIYSLPRHSIQVTGSWGYGTAIPDDAWEAMLQSAVLMKEGQYRLGSTGGRTGFAVTGGVSVQFGIESYTNIVKGWQGKVDAAVATYRRVEC